MTSNLHQPTARVVRIIKQLQSAPEGLSNSQLARGCDIRPGTLHPILKTLCAMHVCSCENYRYRLIDEGNLQSYRLDQIAAFAQDLAREIGHSVQVGVLRASKVLYVLKLDGGSKVILRTAVGDLAPAHTTALGKALLSQFLGDESEFMRHLQLVGGRLEQLSKESITDPQQLYENVQMYEKLGYFSEQGEFDEDFICFAVPVVLGDRIAAAIGVTVLRFFLTEDLKARIIERLRHYGRKISAALV